MKKCKGNCGKDSTASQGYGQYAGDKIIEFVCSECYAKGIKTTAEVARKKQC